MSAVSCVFPQARSIRLLEHKFFWRTSLLSSKNFSHNFVSIARKHNRLMLFSLRGLVTDMAKVEMGSSHCSLVTTLSLMLSTTSVFAMKGNCLVLKMSGTLTQLLNCKISADIPRVPASAGLSQVAKWLHWSALLFFRISLTRFAMKMGYLLVEFIFPQK